MSVRGLGRYGNISLILTGLNMVNVGYLFLGYRLLRLATISFDNFSYGGCSWSKVEMSVGG